MKTVFKRYLLTDSGRIVDTRENIVGPYWNKKKSCYVVAIFVPKLGKFITEKIEKDADTMVELWLKGEQK